LYFPTDRTADLDGLQEALADGALVFPHVPATESGLVGEGAALEPEVDPGVRAPDVLLDHGTNGGGEDRGTGADGPAADADSPLERPLFALLGDAETPAAPTSPFITIEADEETDYSIPPAGEPQFLYIAGDAGTGKSYMARERSYYRDAMLLATTGIAAVNIGGTTINSFLRYFDTDNMQLEYEFGRIGATLRQEATSGVTRLVIDEISMMDGRQLDILTIAVDEANERLRANGEDEIGITLTGDFAQLPPVGVDKKKSEGVIYAFQAKNWDRFRDNTLTLTEVRRQGDADFVKAIQKVRRGDKTAVDYFRPYISMQEIRNFDGSTILAKNDEVDRYNKIRMMQLSTPEELYRSHRKAQDPRLMPSEWKHIPEILVLKEGALVMILANLFDQETKQLIYANGDLGHYLGTVGAGPRKVRDREGAQAGGEEWTTINVPGEFARVKLFRTGEIVYVGRVLRERLKPGIKRDLKPGKVRNPEHVLAEIDYMPLRVAYATTVHKSQGLSLDNVQLMINAGFWMTSGMLYVGLSRARTPQGLRIVGSPEQFIARVRANPAVTEWL
jgi:hypothetical protein